MTSSLSRVSALLIAGAIAVTLAACGGSSDDSTDPGDSAGYPGYGGTKSAKLDTGDVNWPLFGRVEQRQHSLKVPDSLNPPLEQKWSFSDRVLIEYPPAVNDGVAYLADKYGDVRAIQLSDQKVLWDIQKQKRDVGPPSDTTAPDYFEGRVYVAFQNGDLVAFDADTGKIDWKHNIRGGVQSSPVTVDGRLYIGSEEGVVYSFDADTGKVIWTYRAVTPVKTSPSFNQGTVYFGNYSGSVFALDAKTGKQKWRTDTTSTAPGGSGGFYSSPAVAGGKVYLARNDGIVYAFDEKNGKQSWFFQTKGDVYGSPALAEVPGTPLTVYIGSYDSNLYALNASTGKEEWSHDVGGPVPGTATVIGHTVYTSSFKTAKSIGVDVLSHKETFSFDSPGYTPMISDGRNLYLVGYYTLHGFSPK
ncbi:MAG: PQQ-binding-like beta-propeller repeat protein [Thermoleophilia bacterium]|nr:PQQ-binding-like beta-propeller repeat protein [Thermoleophilia bacterium]